MSQPIRFTAYSAGLLALLALVWGSTFLLAEIALRDMGPLTLTFLRVTIAAVAVLAIMRLRGVAVPVGRAIWVRFLVMGALNNAIPFSLIFWGQTRIESGLAAILNSMTAMTGAVVAGLLLSDERLTPNKVAGAGLGVAGVAVIIGPDALRALDPSQLGQLAVLAATVSYAFASVWGKTQLGGQTALANAFGMLTCAALWMLPAAIWVEGPLQFSMSFEAWSAVLVLSVLCTAIAYTLYFRLLALVGAANLMLVTLLVPMLAVVLGFVFLNESLSHAAYAGFALIAIGFIVTDGRVMQELCVGKNETKASKGPRGGSEPGQGS